MANGPEDLILRYLHVIDEKFDRVGEDMREIKTRIGVLEQAYASVSRRIDHIDAPPGADRAAHRPGRDPLKQDRHRGGGPQGRSS